jgi:dTDP-4-amino-4,6-dideoxygalactose transaminase
MRGLLSDKLSAMFSAKHIQLTPSGRSALYLLLCAMPQRKVVVPAYTCKAVVEAALLSRKQVVYVEVNQSDFNMRAGDLERTVDPDSVVIATHQFGIPCDIERICAACDRLGAVVIEDVAAALGTKIKGRLAGTFGAASFYSFDSTKLINVPLKAGFISTNDCTLYESVREVARQTLRPMNPLKKWSLLTQAAVLLALENHIVYRLFHKAIFEWRGRFTADSPIINRTMNDFYTIEMSEWQAFLAITQLDQIEQIVKERRRIYRALHDGLRECKGIELPPYDFGGEWAPIRFPIRTKCDKMAFYRAATREGVDFAFSFTFIAAPEEMKTSHAIAKTILDLPFYSKLTENETRKTVEVVSMLGA